MEVPDFVRDRIYEYVRDNGCKDMDDVAAALSRDVRRDSNLALYAWLLIYPDTFSEAYRSVAQDGPQDVL